MAKRQPVAGQILCRFARSERIAPATWNDADNSVEVIFSTGAAARHEDWEGPFDEFLSLAPGAVRLDRLNSGAAVLAAHDRIELGAVLGSVVPGSARLEGGQGVARIRFADTPDVADIVAKVKAGHIRSVSVGYYVHEWEVREGPASTIRQKTAIDWEPYEISLVSVGADAGAQLRSLAAPPSRDTRIDAILNRSIVAAGLPAELAHEALQRHAARPFNSQEEVMQMVGELFARRQSPAHTDSRVRIHAVGEYSQVRREGMAEAVYCRMAGKRPEGVAREFAGMSLISLAREAMGHEFQRMSDLELAERALHSTSDFTAILLAAGNRYLLDSYAVAESEIKRVCRLRTVSSFHEITAVRLHGFPGLEPVNEQGEVKYGTLLDQGEKYRVKTFAKIVGVTREVLVNDQLGGFSDPLRLMGRAAAECEAMELAALLNGNAGTGPMLSDGKVLFHVDHGNRAAAGGALSLATLSAGRKAMRDQKDPNGGHALNVRAKTLLVGSGQETDAEQLLSDIAAAKIADANPFGGQLDLAVDPRITGSGWRVFADPAQFPVLEYAYLESALGPQMATREGWNVLGTEFRVLLDFGCGAVGWQGAYFNPGA